MNEPVNVDIDSFLKLPDWKKISYKINHPKFSNYPIQTKEQEKYRVEMIYALCAHFAMMNYDDFIQSLTNPINDVWPKAMELFITPTLLDHINLKPLVEYGHCQFCEYYEGYKRIHPRQWNRLRKSPVIPVYGCCEVFKKHQMPYDIIKSLLANGHMQDRVSPFQRCMFWNPVPMIESLIDLKIKKLFTNENFPYYYDDYKNDLAYIDLWDFLLNRYRINR